MTAKNDKVRVASLRRMKEQRRRIAMVSAYDALTGRWADSAGMDIVLVGDSLGNTALGLDGTIPVTLDMMIHHCAAVARSVRRALIVGDMPFMTYKISTEQTLANCARMIQQGGAEVVKLEGGGEVAPVVQQLVRAGIPVMGHIGLLPQSVHAQGGYRVQGRDPADAERLLVDAKCLEDAGAFALVLEGMPPATAGRITEALTIPTIGIGAGISCDGQILVMADMLGLTDKTPPKFVRTYAQLEKQACQALEQYIDDVREGRFPAQEHFYE